MIVDSGAPKSIASTGWIKKDLRGIEVHENEVEEKTCKTRFWFEGNVYKSEKEVNMQRRKSKNRDYIKKKIWLVLLRERKTCSCVD